MIDATESAEAAAFNEEMAVDAPLVDRDAQLYFEEENKILNAMDESFQSEGWKVGSLIFDACLVEHRTDAAFGTAMKAADATSQLVLHYVYACRPSRDATS